MKQSDSWLGEIRTVLSQEGDFAPAGDVPPDFHFAALHMSRSLC